MASSYHEVDSTLQWHHRLGHLHPKSMQTSQVHQLMEGIPRKPFKDLSICEGFIYGKQCRQRFPLHTHQTIRPLQLVHSDLCGPLPTSSITGNRYFITFIDDYTRFTVVYFLKSKAGAFNAFQTYKALAENQCQTKVTTIRTDNGGEYCSKEWINFCNTHGIRHEYSVSYNPQQNGVAERRNRTLLDACQSMLQVAGLQNEYWQEGVATSCYLRNRSPHKVLGSNTPYFLWFKRKPHVGHLRIFGVVAYSHIPSTIRKKLDSHSIKSLFVGYGDCNGIKGYKLYDPQNRKFFYSRSVTFDEDGLFQQASKRNLVFLKQYPIKTEAEMTDRDNCEAILDDDDMRFNHNQKNDNNDNKERGDKTMVENQQIQRASPGINMKGTEQGEGGTPVCTSGKNNKRQDAHQQQRPRGKPGITQQGEGKNHSRHQDSNQNSVDA